MAQRHPSLPDLALAIELQRQGRLAEAEALYRRLLAQQPDNADALHFLGVLQHQAGQSEAAAGSILQALRLSPQYLSAHLNLANILRELGRLPAAVEHYRQALAIEPGHAGACNNLGLVLRRLRRLEESVQVLQDGLARHPDHADLLHNLGNTWQDLKQPERAIDAYRRAIGANPRLASAHLALWKLQLRARRPEAAREVLQQWLQALPDDPIARHQLLAQEGDATNGPVPERAPDAYVRQLFDDFAPSFDQVLAGLDYNGPAMVAHALERLAVPGRPLDILDAGCGTGLCGPLLAPWASRLVGVDLSRRMLERAAARKVYHDLVEAELVDHLQRHPASCQAIVAADTLIYFGDLQAPLQAARSALRAPGLLIVTLERFEGEPGRGFRLTAEGRYAHHQTYVEGLLQASGFEPLSLETVALRQESGHTVWGLLVCARVLP